MNDQSNLTNYLCESVDSMATHIEGLSLPLISACDLMTQTLLSDRKILICGNGLATPIAQLFNAFLISQQEFARPSLPAINLSADPSTLLAISKTSNQHQIFSNQINAIGHKGDILIAFSVDGNCGNIIQAIQAAHDKDIKVIAVTGFDSGKISAVLQTDDIDLKIESKSVARVLELQLLIANSLCHQVDASLFGGMHY